jgi:glutathione S-transferase
MNNQFPAESTPVKLYRNPKSGHCHRVELMLSLLDIPYETIDLDMMNGAHKASEYLKISPLGQVPSIDDNGTILTDSNAILIYLIGKYSNDDEWSPTDPVGAAAVQRWLSIAAGEIAYGPCSVRLVKVFGAELDWDRAKDITDKVFAVMEDRLANNDWLATDNVTVADIAAYSYTAHVQEGAVSLANYPSIRNWLARVETLPRFVGMTRSPELV